MNGMYSAIGQQACVLRTRPDDTPTTNVVTGHVNDALAPNVNSAGVLQTSRLIAIGTLDGYIQLLNAEDMCIEKEFAVHSAPIRCLEWGGSNRVISAGYSQTLSTSAVVRNELLCTDIRNGLTRVIRPETDESQIELMRTSFYQCASVFTSHSRFKNITSARRLSSYLALAFHNQPMEIWDLHSFRLLRRMSRACPVIVDMAWSGKHHHARTMRTKSIADDDVVPPTNGVPPTEHDPLATQPSDASNASSKSKQTIYRENLVVLDNENHLYHVVVKGMHVKDGKEVNTQWATTSQVVSMVWKGDFLAFGDSDGRLSLWDLGTKQSRASAAQRGSVTQLRFSRAPRNYTLVVQHVDGIAVWDAVRFVQLHSVVVGTDLPSQVRLLDVDVCGWDGAIAMLTSDSLVRLVSTNRWQLHAASFNPTALKRVFCSALLSTSSLALLRAVLCDTNLLLHDDGHVGPVQFLFDLINPNESVNLDDSPREFLASSDAELLNAHLQSLGSDAVNYIVSANTISQRCVRVALLLGDSWEQTLWTLVDYHLTDECNDYRNPYPPPCLDMFWKSAHYRRLQMLLRNRSDHVSQSATAGGNVPSACNRDTALALVALGQLDAAVQLLLTPANESYNSRLRFQTGHKLRSAGGAMTDSQAADASYADCLLACLLSAEHSSTACQSTVKLVATNLIAAGKLTEGVLLLCLIGKCADACRYLQSAGQWESAVTLARTALPSSESAEIVRKWAEHVTSPSKSLALLLFVSLGDWSRALETLVAQRQVATGALLLNALHERYGESMMLPEADAGGVQETPVRAVRARLQHEVYAEYSRQLAAMGFTRAALRYCDHAGSLGVNVRKEVQLLMGDKTDTSENR